MFNGIGNKTVTIESMLFAIYWIGKPAAILRVDAISSLLIMESRQYFRVDAIFSVLDWEAASSNRAEATFCVFRQVVESFWRFL